MLQTVHLDERGIPGSPAKAIVRARERG
jgi:hypothetical protein